MSGQERKEAVSIEGVMGNVSELEEFAGVRKVVYHKNGEQTLVAGVPLGNGSLVLVAVDIGADMQSVMKAEGLAVAHSEAAAVNGIEWWIDQHPKGLEYGVLEKLKGMFSVFSSNTE